MRRRRNSGGVDVVWTGAGRLPGAAFDRHLSGRQLEADRRRRAEWMRQNLKMAQPTAAPSDGTLTFNADGTFSTSKVDSKAEVTVPGTSTRATGQMKCASERDVVGGGRHAYAVHELR